MTITGPKAFGIFASFFVVIIAVNVVLAVQAVRTFPGKEVENSFVASQGFDAERRAQEALGWTAEAYLSGGELVLRLTGPDGAPVRGATVAARLGRPTTMAEDVELALAFDGAAWRAPFAGSTGRWVLHLEAVAADGTPFRQRIEVTP